MRIFPSLCSNLCWQINQLFDGDGYKVKVPQDTLALNKCASVRRAAILLFQQLAFWILRRNGDSFCYWFRIFSKQIKWEINLFWARENKLKWRTFKLSRHLRTYQLYDYWSNREIFFITLTLTPPGTILDTSTNNIASKCFGWNF